MLEIPTGVYLLQGILLYNLLETFAFDISRKKTSFFIFYYPPLTLLQLPLGSGLIVEMSWYHILKLDSCIAPEHINIYRQN